MKSMIIALSFTLPLTLLQAQPQECLGRIQFTQPQKFEWALASQLLPMSNTAGFFFADSLASDYKREGIYPLSNSWDYGTNLNIMVTHLINGEAFQRQWRSYLPSAAAERRQKELVETRTRRLKKMIEGRKEQQAMLARGETFPKGWTITEKGIKEVRQHLQEAKEELQTLENATVPVVKLEGIGEEAYTINYDIQRAFVRTGGRDYMFYLSNRGNGRWGFTEDDTTVEEITALLANFQPRQLGELPKQTGFCFPYGLMSDDGKQDYEIKNSFRFSDKPNVIYSLHTGNHLRASRGNIATYGAHTDIQYSNIYTKTDLKQNITLKNGATLELTGWQLTEKEPKDPKKPVVLYHAWGEIKGLFPDNKPYLGVQITSYETHPEAGRTKPAIPFAEALKPLTPILNSIKPFPQ